MSGFLSLIVCVLGLVIYFIASKPNSNQEVKETGRLMFFAGLLAFLLANGSAIVGLFGR